MRHPAIGRRSRRVIHKTGATVQGANIAMDKSTPSVQVFSIDAIGPSLNDWYSGTHWKVRSTTKTNWRLLTKNALRRWRIKPVSGPVALTIVGVFPDGHAYDATNLAATAKLVEDAMVSAGVLQGDGPAFVRRVTLEVARGQGGRRETVVMIEPVPESIFRRPDFRRTGHLPDSLPNV